MTERGERRVAARNRRPTGRAVWSGRNYAIDGRKGENNERYEPELEDLRVSV